MPSCLSTVILRGARGHGVAVLLAAASCVTGGGGAQLQLSLGGAPALRGSVGALSTGRLWVGRIWGTLNCVTTGVGRLGCWGSVDPRPLAASLAGLPAEAWMGCLAAESLGPQCAVVDAGRGRGVEVRALDHSPGSELCAVLVGGGVRCWQRDGRARRVRGIHDAVAVAADGSTGCVRQRDGAVKCWYGASAARLRADISDAVDVDVALGGACAVLRSGGVTCWQHASATRVVAGLSDAREVRLGERLACARLGDGGVACWDVWAGSAARRVPGVAHAVELAVGSEYACARDSDDGVWCWGDNRGFGLGDAESRPFLTRATPVQGIPAAVDVVLGARDACARTVTGELWCWGRRFSAVDAERPVPTRVAEGVRRVALADDGLYAELAGGLHHWQPGAPLGSPRWPRLVDTTALAIGRGWGCAVQAGVLQCFRGALPVDAVTPGWLRPLRAAHPAISTVSAVVSLGADGSRGCVALADGQVLRWGEPFVGQSGAVVAIDRPVVVEGLPPVDAVAVGDGFACARTDAGELWCWGAAEGRPAAATGAAPRRVVGVPPAAQVAVGRGHACARTEAGELWCWGRNDRGQLGRGEVSGWQAEPAPVGGLAQVSAVALAHDTSCVVAAGGEVDCWGDNGGRQASPRGLLRSEQAVPVDPSRITWVDTR